MACSGGIDQDLQVTYDCPIDSFLRDASTHNFPGNPESLRKFRGDDLTHRDSGLELAVPLPLLQQPGENNVLGSEASRFAPLASLASVCSPDQWASPRGDR